MGALCDLVIQVDHKLLEEHKLLLEVLVTGQGVVLLGWVRVGLDVFVLTGRVFDVDKSPIYDKESTSSIHQATSRTSH